jgi:hypothetical protein
MTDPEHFDARAHVAAVAPSVGLRLSPERIEKVAFQLALAARIGAAALNVQVPEEVEPAPVFRP